MLNRGNINRQGWQTRARAKPRAREHSRQEVSPNPFITNNTGRSPNRLAAVVLNKINTSETEIHSYRFAHPRMPKVAFDPLPGGYLGGSAPQPRVFPNEVILKEKHI